MISPISNRVIAYNFNLAGAECFIFVRKVSFDKRILGERLDKAENFLLLYPSLGMTSSSSKWR
jgi:hypothetical protein